MAVFYPLSICNHFQNQSFHIIITIYNHSKTLISLTSRTNGSTLHLKGDLGFAHILQSHLAFSSIDIRTQDERNNQRLSMSIFTIWVSSSSTPPGRMSTREKGQSAYFPSLSVRSYIMPQRADYYSIERTVQTSSCQRDIGSSPAPPTLPLHRELVLGISERRPRRAKPHP